MSTPILPFSVWLAGTNQNSAPANDNSLRNEILHGLVISKLVADQPSSPADGDIYIVPPGATGDQWSTFDPDDLTIYKSGTWYAYGPVEGIRVNVSGTENEWQGSGGWVEVGGGGGSGTVTSVSLSAPGVFSVTGSPVTSSGTLGFSATDPGADRIVFWDDSSGDLAYLEVGTGLSLTGTTLTATGGGSGTVTSVGFSPAFSVADIFSVSGSPVTTTGVINLAAIDPGADRILFWDDSDGKATYLTVGAGLSISGTTITATGVGGLVNITESISTVAPNNSTNSVSLSVTGGTTDADFVLSAKGVGALLASVPDSASSGGNKRGTQAVDFQRSRGASNQVASGNYSFLSGYRSRSAGIGSVAIGYEVAASANYSVAFGQSTVASGQYASAFGSLCEASGLWSFAAGDFSTASGQGTTAFGERSVASISGQHSKASGQFSAQGDAQIYDIVLRRSTTTATPAVVSSTNSAGTATNQVILANNSAVYVRGRIVVRENATGDTASYSFDCLVKRGANAAATSIVGSPSVTQTYADAGATTWIAALSADTTNGGLAVTVTGEAAHTLRWVCHSECVEVRS